MADTACVIYSLAFGMPKPMHRFIIENWAYADFVHFRIFTDQGAAWREKIGSGKSNIEIIDVDLFEWFRTFFPDFGISSHAELTEKYPDFFGGGLNGWTACCMKPFFRKYDCAPTPGIWGWVDYDVLLNASALKQHLIDNADKDLLLFPRDGGVWEQCKLFRSSVDVGDLCRRIIHAPRPDPAPLDVMVSYQIRGIGYSMDDITQNMIASHWKYSDIRDFKENKFDVTIDTKMTITDDKGREILLFIADTETKMFTEEDVIEIEEHLRNGKTHHFPHRPQT